MIVSTSGITQSGAFASSWVWLTVALQGAEVHMLCPGLPGGTVAGEQMLRFGVSFPAPGKRFQRKGGKTYR